MEEPTDAPGLGMFLASTVHDMKNSISVLSGTLENLLANAPPSAVPLDAIPAPAAVGGDVAAAYPALAHMLYQTRRLNDNLIQLLALYKQVGQPGYPFDPQTVAVSELLEQAAAQDRILLQSRGITLDVEVAHELIWTVDEDLIIGVLLHAINNAVRYTRDRIRLTARRDGDYLELRVEDNGAGFPPALLQAGAAASHGQRSGVNFVSNSSGLGLYFSSEVARMHRHRQRHGSVALENGGQLGGGMFVLRLP
ncbi:sensor histidine kinase [Oxalobacteraceae bacterium A2-2]